MSKFYGTVEGNRGEATRCGTPKSGITTQAASWKGAIRTVVFVDDQGRDAYRVEMIPWQGAGESRVIETGVFPGQAESKADAA
jgi:hypothetical protein